MVIDACQFSPPYNYSLLDALAKQGDEIVYATTEFAHGRSPEPENVKTCWCFFLLARLMAKISSAGRLRRVLRAIEYPFDWLYLLAYILIRDIRIVHYMWVVTPAFDVFMMKLLKQLNRKIVYTAHNPFPHDHKERDIESYCRVYRQADQIIALTEYSRNEILQKVQDVENSVHVIPHGDYEVLFSRAGFNQALFDDVKRKAGNRHIVSFLGSIRPYKGLDFFIQAIPLIRSQSSNYFFLIGGSVITSGGKEEWLEKTGQLGGDDICIDIRFLPTENFKAYLELTEVLVQPYISASQSGNTVMAYAAGKPVISTDVGGLGEMTEDGKTGYVIAPQNPQAIAEAVIKCFEGDNYPRMSQQARRVARETYSWKTIAEQTRKIYITLEGIRFNR